MGDNNYQPSTIMAILAAKALGLSEEDAINIILSGKTERHCPNWDKRKTYYERLQW